MRGKELAKVARLDDHLELTDFVSRDRTQNLLEPQLLVVGLDPQSRQRNTALGFTYHASEGERKHH